MAKQLTFTFEDKEYTLEFTRKTVTEMEKRGFVAAEVEHKPMSTLPALFEGAFLEKCTMNPSWRWSRSRRLLRET